MSVALPKRLSSSMAKSVCIVGAGPSGLVAAKTLLHDAPKGTSFKVTVYDAQKDIGGLWPTSQTDSQRQIHPLMVANQSKHTVHFSDLTWGKDAPQFPRAWEVGQYLQRYLQRYLEPNPDFELRLNSRVVGSRLLEGGKGWDVFVSAEEQNEARHFDHIIVASGFFGKPIIPENISEAATIPVIHSSQYRDLQSLLRNAKPDGRKILVVGGQMSGVEIAGTIATHLSSAVNSPDQSSVPNIDEFSIHHVIQRPIWVFPLFTSPEATKATAPFLPLDFASYNRSNRPAPLVNTQGHISEDTAKMVNGIFQAVLGNDQHDFSPRLGLDDAAKSKQPYLAVSDWYCDFVRSGLITLATGKLESLEDTTAVLSSDGENIEDVAAVVMATGFDASSCLDFLPKDVLSNLQHSPSHISQPIALAFHGTQHPDVPGLGFVGFYRSPYWGVMQMQARFLADFWSDGDKSPAMMEKLAKDVSVQRTLDLRDDPRVSQFPMGDYPFLMQEIAEALSMDIQTPANSAPNLSHNDMPLDMLTASRYISPRDDTQAKAAAQESMEDTQSVAVEGLTGSRFVARAVFRSLLGTWKLQRDLESKLPSHPSGHFSGTAQFLLRDKTYDGLSKSKVNGDQSSLGDKALEYLYIEDGEFKTESGFGFRATRRYIWRFDEAADTISVWFAKTDDTKRADYLFHEIEFLPPDEMRENGWDAKAGHLCIDDFYNVKYNFKFQAVNLKEWNIGYTVNGPKKDYTIKGTYTR